MTPFARRILAVLAISAVTTVQSASAQQAFVSDATPPLTGYRPAPPRPQPRGSWEANNYRVARRTQMESEVVQPKSVQQAPSSMSSSGSSAPSGWGDEGTFEHAGSGDCGCDGGCGGDCESGSCGCDSCNCCDRCEKHCGYYAGGALVWARPFFQHNTAFTTTDTISDGVTAALFTATPFEYDYETTPRVWFGYENACGFGVRGRYWQFDQNAQGLTFEDTGVTATVNLPEIIAASFGNAGSISTITGDTLSLRSGLEMHVVDIEATQRFKLGCTDVVGSVGARYARLQQDFFATFVDANVETVGLMARQQTWEGAGLTAALEVRRPIPCCCCNLALVGSARGSILFGERQIRAAELLIDDGTDAFAFARTEDEVIGVGEITGGVEWSHCCCCGVRMYAQAIVEAQLWDGAGNASDSDSNLGFLGYGFTVGVAR